jgi:large subunit ribosomal protein L35
VELPVAHAVKRVKAKTHKGLKRRLKVTATGKIMHRRSGKSHLMSGKSGKKVRQLRRWAALPKSECRILKRQYGFS